jgi:GMP synthase (glutamine-hydrolysing)
MKKYQGLPRKMPKNYSKFINEKIKEIREIVGNEKALSVLSGGVDSSTVTILGKKALGRNLKAVFINNGLMREGEPENVVKIFKNLGMKVEEVNAQNKFFKGLKGKTDPEEKRKAITAAFYKDVFRKVIKEKKIKFLLQGTILTDIEETVAGIKRQHNVLSQVGINPEKEYGYQIIEPLIKLRKNGVRKVAKLLSLPREIHQRIPFPGPALAARVIGEVTPEKIAIIRKATSIVEKELKNSGAFQYFPVLMRDKATGIRNNKREFGNIIIIRCVESLDARTATPKRLPWKALEKITKRITTEIPKVIRVCYDLTPKPPATIEYV